MSRIQTQLVLLVTLAALMGLHWLLGPNPDQRSWQWLPEMVDPVPFESFASSPVFADGKVLQPPPAGTVPRGLPPLHYEATDEDARRAGRELTNPFSRDAPAPRSDGTTTSATQGDAPEEIATTAAGTGSSGVLPSNEVARQNELQARYTAALNRGAAVYATFCEICHGPGGAGDGTVARRGFPAPPSLLAEKARNLADGEMFHILTYGRANMPSYRSQIDREDRWRALLHVRRLQQEAPAEPASTEPTPPGAGAILTDVASEPGSPAPAPRPTPTPRPEGG